MNGRSLFAMCGTFLVFGIGVHLLFEANRVEEPAITAAKLSPVKSSESTSGTQKAHPSGESAKVAETAEKNVRGAVVPQEKLSLLYIVKCSACHGRDGKGPVGPQIAGKKDEENLRILKKYKAGEVENTMMADLLTRTADEELSKLAREISAFR